MSAPTAPTLTTIVTEAIKKTGELSPSSTDITRGEDYFIEEVKNDIWRKEKKLKSLYTSDILMLTKGLSKYSNPTDYSSQLSLVLLDGTNTGSVQAATSSTITLSNITKETYSGSALDDMTSGGTFTGTSDLSYKVEIDGTGTPDTFKWSDDGGSTWDAETVAITGSAQTLNNGVTVTFAATTGHTSTNSWTFKGLSSTPVTLANTIGKEVLITSGTGAKEFSQCIGYNETTRVLTVSPNFSTTPDSTSDYMIVDDYSNIDKMAIRVLDQENNPTDTGKPLEYYPTEDNDY